METKGERRLRKLQDLCAKYGGHAAVAEFAGLNDQALDQILKGVLLPAKADGSRSAKALGDAAARAIEDAYKLGRGWFDTDETRPALPEDIYRMAYRLNQVKDAMTRAAILAMAATATDVALERQAEAEAHSAHAPRKTRGRAA